MSIMYEIFIGIFADFWSDGLFGKFMAIMWESVIILTIGLIFVLIFYLMDSIFLNYKEGEGIVIEKTFDPAHSETHLQSQLIGKTIILIPVTRSYGDRYFINVSVNEKNDNVQIPQEMFNKINLKEIISIKYAQHRFSNSISIDSVKKID